MSDYRLKLDISSFHLIVTSLKKTNLCEWVCRDNTFAILRQTCKCRHPVCIYRTVHVLDSWCSGNSSQIITRTRWWNCLNERVERLKRGWQQRLKYMSIRCVVTSKTHPPLRGRIRTRLGRFELRQYALKHTRTQTPAELDDMIRDVNGDWKADDV